MAFSDLRTLWSRPWKTRPNYSVRETIDFLPQFVHKPANFEPGEGCRYNKCAFVLLGMVIEKLTRQRYREYVRENVFEGAGMASTGFVTMDGIAGNVAEGCAAVTDERDDIVGWRKNIYSFPLIGSPDSGRVIYMQKDGQDIVYRVFRGSREWGVC